VKLDLKLVVLMVVMKVVMLDLKMAELWVVTKVAL